MAENNSNSTPITKKTLVLLHGWGVNSAIFEPLSQQLSPYFQVVCLDLPGFGDSINTSPIPYVLESVAEMVANQIPDNSILAGWSLGGLVATKIALNHSEKVSKLIHIASSPCFVVKDAWPGIKANVLASFHQQLDANISKTLSGFLKLQAMGSPHVREDIRLIQQLVEQKPQPSKLVLDSGLNILEQVDLRDQLANIQQPFLRIYGKLDSLVPNKAVELIDQLAPNSKSVVVEKASHAPFISHQVEFIDILKAWLDN
ncbi:pimeloyl-ACP methyl ester esterase BioH [Thalassotalea sp. LPB0316]|uniref:pimeloyl-ACP methyl ester esterase BioH n=1 Tax=Thalassotalea sp. LPB0316 TaxID=2769490 RepID=UPI001866BA5B|nr:pimeloyl-ACP methyl ester esterase BioH [Thalassotalea sp. LPB0316]QOL26216.1 pimeloyl-ACP methyl ester esterase BioH [Thalassotalea sp. LPB0316]